MKIRRYKNNFTTGVISIITASVLWAISFYLRKLISTDAGPFLVTLLSSWFALIFFIIFFKIRPTVMVTALKENPKYFICNSLLSVAIASTAMYYGLSKIDLSISVVLEKMQPFYTIVLAYFFLSENNSSRVWLLTLFAILVSIMLAFSNNNFQFKVASTDNLVGVFFVTLAALSWAGAGVLGRLMAVKQIESKMIATMRVFIGSILILPFTIIEMLFYDFNLSFFVLGNCLLIGIIGGSFGYVLYYYGLKFVQAGTASLIELFTPVTGILLGVMFLNEKLSILSSGLILVLFICIFLVIREKQGL